MNSIFLRSLVVPKSPSLKTFAEYREQEQTSVQKSSVEPNGSLLEYETLELRIHPPNVVIGHEYDDRTVFTIDSANRPGTLVEVVQLLTELGLSVIKARISSDGGWFVDEFHISESGGGRVSSKGKLSALKNVLSVESDAVTAQVLSQGEVGVSRLGGGTAGSFFGPALALINNVDGKSGEPFARKSLAATGSEATSAASAVRGGYRGCIASVADQTLVFEMRGADRPGLFADVAQALKTSGFEVLAASIWTSHGRAAFVMSVSKATSASAPGAQGGGFFSLQTPGSSVFSSLGTTQRGAGHVPRGGGVYLEGGLQSSQRVNATPPHPHPYQAQHHHSTQITGRNLISSSCDSTANLNPAATGDLEDARLLCGHLAQVMDAGTGPDELDGSSAVVEAHCVLGLVHFERRLHRLLLKEQERQWLRYRAVMRRRREILRQKLEASRVRLAAEAARGCGGSGDVSPLRLVGGGEILGPAVSASSPKRRLVGDVSGAAAAASMEACDERPATATSLLGGGLLELQKPVSGLDIGREGSTLLGGAISRVASLDGRHPVPLSKDVISPQYLQRELAKSRLRCPLSPVLASPSRTSSREQVERRDIDGKDLAGNVIVNSNSTQERCAPTPDAGTLCPSSGSLESTPMTSAHATPLPPLNISLGIAGRNGDGGKSENSPGFASPAAESVISAGSHKNISLASQAESTRANGNASHMNAQGSSLSVASSVLSRVGARTSESQETLPRDDQEARGVARDVDIDVDDTDADEFYASVTGTTAIEGCPAAPGESPGSCAEMQSTDKTDEELLRCFGPSHNVRVPVPDVRVRYDRQLDYWTVYISCLDRPKLLFDTVCTLSDLEYDIFHGSIDSEMKPVTLYKSRDLICSACGGATAVVRRSAGSSGTETGIGSGSDIPGGGRSLTVGTMSMTAAAGAQSTGWFSGSQSGRGNGYFSSASLSASISLPFVSLPFVNSFSFTGSGTGRGPGLGTSLQPSPVSSLSLGAVSASGTGTLAAEATHNKGSSHPETAGACMGRCSGKPPLSQSSSPSPSASRVAEPSSTTSSHSAAGSRFGSTLASLASSSTCVTDSRLRGGGFGSSAASASASLLNYFSPPIPQGTKECLSKFCPSCFCRSGFTSPVSSSPSPTLARTAEQTFYVRPRLGSSGWDVASATYLKFMLEVAIQRRYAKGIRAQTYTFEPLVSLDLAALTASLARHNLNITRAEVLSFLGGAEHTFFLVELLPQQQTHPPHPSRPPPRDPARSDIDATAAESVSLPSSGHQDQSRSGNSPMNGSGGGAPSALQGSSAGGWATRGAEGNDEAGESAGGSTKYHPTVEGEESMEGSLESMLSLDIRKKKHSSLANKRKSLATKSANKGASPVERGTAVLEMTADKSGEVSYARVDASALLFSPARTEHAAARSIDARANRGGRSASAGGGAQACSSDQVGAQSRGRKTSEGAAADPSSLSVTSRQPYGSSGGWTSIEVDEGGSHKPNPCMSGGLAKQLPSSAHLVHDLCPGFHGSRESKIRWAYASRKEEAERGGVLEALKAKDFGSGKQSKTSKFLDRGGDGHSGSKGRGNIAGVGSDLSVCLLDDSSNGSDSDSDSDNFYENGASFGEVDEGGGGRAPSAPPGEFSVLPLKLSSRFPKRKEGKYLADEVSGSDQGKSSVLSPTLSTTKEPDSGESNGGGGGGGVSKQLKMAAAASGGIINNGKMKIVSEGSIKEVDSESVARLEKSSVKNAALLFSGDAADGLGEGEFRSSLFHCSPFWEPPSRVPEVRRVQAAFAAAGGALVEDGTSLAQRADLLRQLRSQLESRGSGAPYSFAFTVSASPYGVY